MAPDIFARKQAPQAGRWYRIHNKVIDIRSAQAGAHVLANARGRQLKPDSAFTTPVAAPACLGAYRSAPSAKECGVIGL